MLFRSTPSAPTFEITAPSVSSINTVSNRSVPPSSIGCFRTAASVRTPLGQLADRTLQLRRWLDGIRGAGMTFTADPATDFLNIVNNGIATNDPVVLASTGTLPAGTNALTTYYWNEDDSDNGYLSATIGGGKIDIASVCTGTHTLYPVGAAHMWLPVGACEASNYPDAQSLLELLGTIATDIATDRKSTRLNSSH